MQTDAKRCLPPHVRRVTADRPWVWLARGWRDLMANRAIGLLHGAALVLFGWALTLLLFGLGAAWAILPATAGFFILAPLLAASLYEVSRRTGRGEATGLVAALAGIRRNGTQLALMGMALLLAHLLWVRVAGLLFALCFGPGFTPSLAALPMAMLQSDRLLPFLVIGTGFGCVLAAASFAVSVVAVPMLVDREVSVFEAMAVSIRAVRANPGVMLLWAGLIVLFTGLALVPFFLGLLLVLPLVGHATWHAYQDLVAWDRCGTEQP